MADIQKIEALLIAHTEEMVTAAMGSTLARLAEDPGWIRRMELSGTVADAVKPAAESFMKYRGNLSAQHVALDILELDLKQGAHRG